MNSSLLSGIFNGCNWVDQRQMITHAAPAGAGQNREFTKMKYRF
jgi:hypothetical protein